nr:unknown [Zea mays]
MDLVTPFYNSVKQIVRETSIVTTRRVFERIVVRHVSQRTAWKLLKDASKSSKRKAARGMPTPQYTYCVARTTFRAHALGITAAWVVQSIIEVYRCFIRKPSEDCEALSSDGNEQFDDMNKFRLFGRKIYGITIKSCFSLVLASAGAGIGALVHPVHGQWLGCALGDVAGPIIAIIVFKKMQLPL